MAYQALYRTYRPTKFNEVVGQKHIIQTLQNAVLEKKTSHAYIFSGLRGIGKTTIARIFAKAVNCENSYDGEPCDSCDNCKAIIEDATTDVVELDAASNNGVDQMRDILEKVNFLPSTLNKKIYIIDEAHMLSTAAFNALLKTLEEPPAHVIFILATTEPYKIPSTILSRCQRLDFKQLSTNDIVDMLINVASKEKIKITDEALVAIAEASEGGMRDALSILDQARVYNFNQITLDNINDITGRVSFDYLVDLIRALNLRDPGEALSKAELLIESGKEVSRILSNLIQFCRDLLLYKNLKEEVTSSYIYRKDVFSQVAREISEAKLFYYVDMFVDIQNKIRFTNSPKLHLEVGIIKIVNNANSDIDVMSKIQKLEEKLELVQPSSSVGSINEVSLRLDNMDNKIRKITTDLGKINIDEFKESILSKINMLEDMVLQTKNAPQQMEEQIQELRNSINLLETMPSILPASETEEKPSSEFELKLQELEQKINNSSSNSFDSSIIDAKLAELEAKIATNNNDQVDLKLAELEQKIVNTPTNTFDSSNIDAKLAELEQKLENVPTNTFDSTNIDAKLAELEAKISSQSYVSQPESNNNNYDFEIKRLQSEIELIKNSSNNMNQPVLGLSSNNRELEDKVNVVEEYLDMVINRVDELARNIKASQPVEKTEDVPTSDEISQLNENYLSLITYIQELQNKVNSQEGLSPDAFDSVKSEFNERINQTVAELIAKIEENQAETSNKVNANYSYFQDQINEIDNKVSSNYNYFQDQINELDNKEQTPVVDYSPLIEENKQAIQEVKDYSFKLSGKVKEIQDRINEVNTKLDGGYTKRRSPFEYVREDEPQKEEVKPQVQEVVKEEVVASPTPEEVKPIEVEEKPKATITKNEKTTVIRSEFKPIQAEKVDESSKIYDAKIVERILHQARDRKCREEKVQILNNWHKMEVKVGHLLAPTAKLLSEGTLTANGFNELLIVFPHASMCNHLMEPKGHTNAIQILKTTFGKDYDFIALPENTWQEKRLEYAGQYNMGIKYPKLTPIKNPELKIVVVNSTNLMSKKNQSVHKAQSFFGEDMVEKEEE